MVEPDGTATTPAPTTSRPASPYRPEAIEHLRSPERLDQVVQVTRVGAWIAVATGVLAVVLFLVWASVATIPQRFSVSGVMSRTGAFTQVFAPEEGVVSSIAAAPGDQLDAGVTVVTLATSGGSTGVTTSGVGVVQAVMATVGQTLPAGAPVATLVDESSSSTMQAFTYVSATQALELANVDTVTVQPTTVDPAVYGALVGTVSFVADLPASTESMAEQLDSEPLAESLASSILGAPYLVVVDFGDPLQWTDGPAPPFDVADATLADISAITAQVRPIDLIFG